ncbi:MAG: SH3 domain-containing protein [Lachnospiraceae bacterium]|nr:SH3 domain-containing protein [Lachnospiraceae bacterium]
MDIQSLRRSFAFGCALVLFFNVAFHVVAPPGTAYAYAVRSATVSASTLNVRTGPGTTYTKLTTLTKGAAVTVIGEDTASDGALWYEIRFTDDAGQTQAGFVSQSYIKFSTAYSNDPTFEEYLTRQGFPESYKEGLRELHAQYPSWVFVAQHLNLDWETAVQNESVIGRNLVHTENKSSWKSIADGAYDWTSSTWPGFDGATWVAASEGLIRHYMDPRNFLDETYIFQFLAHQYDQNLHTKDGLLKIVNNTFLASGTQADGSVVSITPDTTGYSQDGEAVGYGPGYAPGLQSGGASGTGATSGAGTSSGVSSSGAGSGSGSATVGVAPGGATSSGNVSGGAGSGAASATSGSASGEGSVPQVVTGDQAAPGYGSAAGGASQTQTQTQTQSAPQGQSQSAPQSQTAGQGKSTTGSAPQSQTGGATDYGVYQMAPGAGGVRYEPGGAGSGTDGGAGNSREYGYDTFGGGAGSGTDGSAGNSREYGYDTFGGGAGGASKASGLLYISPAALAKARAQAGLSAHMMAASRAGIQNQVGYYAMAGGKVFVGGRISSGVLALAAAQTTLWVQPWACAQGTLRGSDPAATFRRVTNYGPGMDSGAVSSDAPGGTGSTSAGTSGTNALSGSADYVEIIMNAAAQSGVSPYVLASMILQEQGTKGTSNSISGTAAGYTGYYNFFNVEAYQAGDMTAVQRGLWYASQSGSYLRPWNSPEKSILGGALFYAQTYVNAGQDTFYLKKFNVQGDRLYMHQYMTNVLGAASESALFARAFDSQLRSTALQFKIPVYTNMPAANSPLPMLDGSPNNKLAALTVENHALTPTFNRDTLSYDVIVGPDTTQVKVGAVALDSTAYITGTGLVTLKEGDNQILVAVTAKNGTIRTYTIDVVRQGSSGAGTGVSSPDAGVTAIGAPPGSGSASGAGTDSQVIQVGPGVSSSGSTSGGSGTDGSGTVGTAPPGSGTGTSQTGSTGAAGSSETSGVTPGNNVTTVVW